MISFPLPPLILEVADGDIAAQDTDAVVNAANTAFWMGSGVAGALKARGGARIEADAMAQGPVEPGEVVVTSAGRLPARHVIHAAVMGQDLQTSAASIERATINSLERAEALALTSIAFPALGTGVGGFPLDRCARTMFAAIHAHVTPATSLRLIRFILLGLPAYRVFAEIAGETFGAPLDGPADCPVSG
jgi:O-acetyl-ADP-ribose deacetylase (regulator of RNase III)